MRWWVHKLWKDKNGPLKTQGPKDDKGIEALITQHSERTAAIAWALYVYEHPPKYSTWDPDPEKITKFPLASFLKMQDGYIVDAIDRLHTRMHPEAKRIAELREAEVVAGVQAVPEEELATALAYLAEEVWQGNDDPVNVFHLVDEAMAAVPPAPLQRKW